MEKLRIALQEQRKLIWTSNSEVEIQMKKFLYFAIWILTVGSLGIGMGIAVFSVLKKALWHSSLEQIIPSLTEE